MSQAASQAARFYSEVAQSGLVWTLQDAGGCPAPMTSSSQRAQPFWSSRARARKIVDTVPAYAGFEVIEVPWTAFEREWGPDLEKDGLLVGVNWSGPRAVGYDLAPADVCARVRALRGEPPPAAGPRRPWWAVFGGSRDG